MDAISRFLCIPEVRARTELLCSLKEVCPLQKKKLFSVLLAKLNKLAWTQSKEKQERWRRGGIESVTLDNGLCVEKGRERRGKRHKRRFKGSSGSGVSIVKFAINVPNLWCH